MKTFLLSILIIVGFTIAAFAQEAPKRVTTRRVTEEELMKRIVKDSTGVVLPYEQWSKLMQSGLYSIVNPTMETDTFTLKKLTESEIAIRVANAPQPMSNPSFPPGAKMEMFSAKDITGKKINPKELAGKIIVLNFWFIACPPCKEEIPELNKIADKYASDNKIVFIAVCLDQRSEINDFMKETPFSFRQVADGRYISEGFSVNSYPTNVVIDKQGVIRYSSMGYGWGTANWLKKAIDEIYSEN